MILSVPVHFRAINHTLNVSLTIGLAFGVCRIKALKAKWLGLDHIMTDVDIMCLQIECIR